MTCAPPSSAVFPIGRTTVACTATDAAGNSAGVTFVVTVTRRDPPVPPQVRGLADFHSHQFSHLGFGGQLLSHGVQPSGGCLRP